VELPFVFPERVHCDSCSCYYFEDGGVSGESRSWWLVAAAVVVDIHIAVV